MKTLIALLASLLLAVPAEAGVRVAVSAPGVHVAVGRGAFLHGGGFGFGGFAHRGFFAAPVGFGYGRGFGFGFAAPFAYGQGFGFAPAYSFNRAVFAAPAFSYSYGLGAPLAVPCPALGAGLLYQQQSLSLQQYQAPLQAPLPMAQADPVAVPLAVPACQNAAAAYFPQGGVGGCGAAGRARFFFRGY
jgi:hypothetical protein